MHSAVLDDPCLRALMAVPLAASQLQSPGGAHQNAMAARRRCVGPQQQQQQQQQQNLNQQTKRSVVLWAASSNKHRSRYLQPSWKSPIISGAYLSPCFAPSSIKDLELGIQRLGELRALQGPRYCQSKPTVEIRAEGAVEAGKCCSPVIWRRRRCRLAASLRSVLIVCAE